jgi:hypothetical protein
MRFASLRLVALCFVVAVGVIAAAATPTSAGQTAAACGSRLWGLKTLSDTGRTLIYLRPLATTTIAEVNTRPMPQPTPSWRSRGFARRVWMLVAQIVEFKLEDDGDIHLILFDAGAYMIAKLPSPACVPRTSRDRGAIISARRSFESRCGPVNNRWQPLGAVAHITGVGFWDFPHGQRGHARNYAELHPVTGIRFVAGCGK